MTGIQHINPEGVFDPSAIYTHVVIPPPGRVVFMAGQWGVDADGRLVAGGFASQVDRAFTNVRANLEALGMGLAHVAKLTHYVVDLDDERRAELHRHIGTLWPGNRPASTLLGIARLARVEMLYEVDVQAVLPD